MDSRGGGAERRAGCRQQRESYCLIRSCEHRFKHGNWPCAGQQVHGSRGNRAGSPPRKLPSPRGLRPVSNATRLSASGEGTSGAAIRVSEAELREEGTKQCGRDRSGSQLGEGPGGKLRWRPRVSAWRLPPGGLWEGQRVREAGQLHCPQQPSPQLYRHSPTVVEGSRTNALWEISEGSLRSSHAGRPSRVAWRGGQAIGRRKL